MTVKELIEALKLMPQDVRVVFNDSDFDLISVDELEMSHNKDYVELTGEEYY